VRLYLHELRGQMLLYTRSRELAFFTFLFPLILFLLLGSAYGDEEIEGIRGSDFLMAGTLGFGAVATAFGGLAIVLVLRREEGILKRLRATPLPGVAYVAAVLSTTMLAFLVQAVVTVAIAMLAFGASFPDRPASLIAALVLGAATFAALGVAITGFIRHAEGASAVVNAIYFPVLFISGSFFSQGSFPTILERVANVLPVSHFIQLVQAICVRDESIWEHPTDVAVIAAWGLAGAVVAVRTFRWTPTEG
jgi:ABC-2 type transport system permease protein